MRGRLLRGDAKCLGCAAPTGAVSPPGNVADFDGARRAGDRRHRPSRGDHGGEGGACEEPKRPTAADRALGQSAGKIVEGASGRFLAHLCPPLHEGRDTRGLAPPSVDQRRQVCRVTSPGATSENYSSKTFVNKGKNKAEAALRAPARYASATFARVAAMVLWQALKHSLKHSLLAKQLSPPGTSNETGRSASLPPLRGL